MNSLKNLVVTLTVLPFALLATEQASEQVTEKINEAAAIADSSVVQAEVEPLANPYLYILGVAQDAGRPQAGCFQPHCLEAYKDPSKARYATSLALISRAFKQDYLFEASPDIKWQLFELYQETNPLQHHLAGVFITHAHIGHYAGLMNFGREVMATNKLPVYALPRLVKFLTTNGPWSQLVSLGNIELRQLKARQALELTVQVSVTPILVPHRDEFSETAGFVIKGPNKTALFIPDIDKWERWSLVLSEQLNEVDYALIDASFYDHGELPNRDMNEIPHPLVTSTMSLLAELAPEQKQKVYFIHMNHTNPMLDQDSEASKRVKENGFNIARRGMKLEL
jgi:pyrroloquinoline quinone biosynthesis protein B